MSRNHISMKLWGPRWERLRRMVFKRDGYRCVLCRGAGRLECDHVVPLHRGGPPFDINNLQTCCRSCHLEKTRSENLHEPTPAEQEWRKALTDIMI